MYSVTGQNIDTLNSIDYKFVNLLKTLVFLCQLYCVTTPDSPNPGLFRKLQLCSLTSISI